LDFFISAAAFLSLVYILTVYLVPWPQAPARKDMIEASRLMEEAVSAVRECREEAGVSIDPSSDINRTGLVGLETSPLTTSLGNLGAKRTTTNPNMAGLMISLLKEAGVRRGDAVAVGASSSFPASIIAALAAVQTLGAESLIISSLGASEWGANDPDFDWLAVEECLLMTTELDVRPLALALGGDEDVGRGMNPEFLGSLRKRIRETGIFFIEEPILRTNVETRMRIYAAGAGRRPIRAFVNVGGSYANMGINSEILKLRPGLNREIFIPPAEERGVIQAMAAKGIPVIHLLNIKGLAERYGLPWDPLPLPGPGEGELYRIAATKESWFLLLTVGYILLFVSSFLIWGRRIGSLRSFSEIEGKGLAGSGPDYS
jgi:poly-gamma-glutamate system protein